MTVKEKKTANDPNNDNALISFWALRKAVGGVAIALPIVLIVGKLVVHQVCPECGSYRGPFQDLTIQRSISSYYWTSVGDILVGSLAAIAIFLFAYKGAKPSDSRAGNLACAFALGVALFPTTRDDVGHTTGVGIVHYVSAGLLFATLAYFCFVIFQRPDIEPTDNLKPVRNWVYFVCGIMIIACIASIGLVHLLDSLEWMKPGFLVFVFEALAIWAFGWSWFVKGKGFNILRR